jgi:hypothetical protein
MSTHSQADLVECSDEDVLVHEWRREQLQCQGVPKILADSFADVVDWHQIADLVGRGCPPHLALEIAW